MPLGELATGVTTNLIANYITDKEKPTMQLIKKLFTSKNNKPGTIAAGLAVGYFYNFISSVANEISQNGLVLQKDNAEKQEFDPNNVKIRFIIPSLLSVESFKNCKNEMDAVLKGSIIFKCTKERPVGIGYVISEDGTELTIVDYVKPVIAIKFYYEEILNFNTSQKNQEWIDTQKLEIAAFKKSIEEMLSKGNGLFINKHIFYEIN